MINLNHVYTPKKYAEIMNVSPQLVNHWIKFRKVQSLEINTTTLVYDPDIKKNQIRFNGVLLDFEKDLQDLVIRTLQEFSKNEGDLMVKDLRQNKESNLNEGQIVELFTKILIDQIDYAES